MILRSAPLLPTQRSPECLVGLVQASWKHVHVDRDPRAAILVEGGHHARWTKRRPRALRVEAFLREPEDVLHRDGVAVDPAHLADRRRSAACRRRSAAAGR